MKTVRDLRREGHKVRVTHYRILHGVEVPRHTLKQTKNLQFVSVRGGKTVLDITTIDGQNYRTFADCSKKDNFCYRRGVQIALGRFFNEYESQKVNFLDNK